MKKVVLVLAALAVLAGGAAAYGPRPSSGQVCGPAQPCGDINDSGTVTAADALTVLRKAVGLPVNLQCGCAASDGSTGLPETGQTASYGPGSDGEQQWGLARKFTDNGDGTVTDNVTGLMWEKKSDNGDIHDKDNAYTWGLSASPYVMNGAMVTTFLASLNSGGGFAGHTDWRIPNRFELETLLDLGAYIPATYSAFDNGCYSGCSVTTCSCCRPDAYWTSTSSQGYPHQAWYVSFYFGSVYFNGNKPDSYFVRAVRAGS